MKFSDFNQNLLTRIELSVKSSLEYLKFHIPYMGAVKFPKVFVNVVHQTRLLFIKGRSKKKLSERIVSIST